MTEPSISISADMTPFMAAIAAERAIHIQQWRFVRRARARRVARLAIRRFM